MLTDTLLDWLSAPVSWIIGQLPSASAEAAAALADNPNTTLRGLAANPLITGGIGVLFNGALFAAMLASWIVIEAAIQAVRGIIWVKKSLLF